jgi:hypothetical protein
MLGLEAFSSMDVKHVETFGDSLLVLQQIPSTFQYLNGSLNAYLNKCLKNIVLFNDFTVQHISRDKNTVVNDLAQQASGLRANRGKFDFLKNPNILVCQTGQPGFQPVHSARIYSTEPNSAELDSPVSETEGSRIFRTSNKISKTMMAGPDDWRTPLVRYLENPSHIADRKV